jgi:hypothetical protein
MRQEVLEGMFFLNEGPIIMLFDSRASDDFMSATSTKKAKLSLVAPGEGYVISTPRGRVDVDRIAQKVRSSYSGRYLAPTLSI